jgi:hypothetical protein
MPYAFRLRVVFPSGRGISAVEDDAMPMAVLPGEGANVTLHAWTAQPLNATELFMTDGGAAVLASCKGIVPVRLCQVSLQILGAAGP